jgi:long-subunit acyl-CoA synthetase (AMP-forming)
MERTHNAVGLFEGNEHRYFSYLPLNHIAERLIVELACMHNGGCISFAESLDSFVKNLQQTRPTLFLGVPRIWSKFQLAILEKMPQHKLGLLLKIPILSNLIKKKIQKGLGLDQARVTFTGAAPAPDSLKQWFRRLDINVREVYGMTENCAGCSLMLRGANKDGTVGQLLPEVELKTDPESGEIIMRAPWLMRGYYKDEVKTREILRDGWLHTGDQGELDAAGYLRITGRVADTFKSAKGKFIVPAPIEWGFAQNSYIEQICIVGLTLPQPVALTVLSEIGKNASRETVVQSLQQTLRDVNDSLANFERLAKVVVVREAWNVENGILTPTLKIKRNVVNQRYAPYLQQWYEQGESIVWE